MSARGGVNPGWRPTGGPLDPEPCLLAMFPCPGQTFGTRWLPACVKRGSSEIKGATVLGQAGHRHWGHGCRPARGAPGALPGGPLTSAHSLRAAPDSNPAPSRSQKVRKVSKKVKGKTAQIRPWQDPALWTTPARPPSPARPAPRTCAPLSRTAAPGGRSRLLAGSPRGPCPPPQLTAQWPPPPLLPAPLPPCTRASRERRAPRCCTASEGWLIISSVLGQLQALPRLPTARHPGSDVEATPPQLPGLGKSDSCPANLSSALSSSSTYRTHVHTYACAHTCIHVHTQDTHVHTCACKHTHMCTPTHTSAHARACTYVQLLPSALVLPRPVGPVNGNAHRGQLGVCPPSPFAFPLGSRPDLGLTAGDLSPAWGARTGCPGSQTRSRN